MTEASLNVEVYKMKIGGPKDVTFVTRMVTDYKTKALDQLENYGVTQFVKGCQFSSYLDADGVEQRDQEYAYEQDGKYIPYVFTKWQIDGFVGDPLEWGSVSSKDGSRHRYYWNHEPTHAGPMKVDFFAYKKPETPELWLRDYPYPASYFSSSHKAKNVSMQFKTCFYKSADVPRVVPFDQVDFATPIHCFEWSISYIYNHKKGEFESPKGIDPYCDTVTYRP